MRVARVFSILSIMALAAPSAYADGSGSAPAVGVVDGAAHRAPLHKVQSRGTALKLDRYHNHVTIVRRRTPGKMYASFHAEPKLLDDGAVVVFVVRSVAATGVVPRWRCVAIHDVAECLGAPIRLRYLPADREIVLTATLVPENELAAALEVASR